MTKNNYKVRKKYLSNAKREAILVKATEVFLGDGFGAASMYTISKKAGVSKATVYSHFENKEKLFGAVIEKNCCDLLIPLHVVGAPENDIEATLYKISEYFIDLVLREPILSLYRVVIAEAIRFPTLARVFYETGPKHTAEIFADYLLTQNEREQFYFPDPVRAAEHFFSLLSGHMHMRELLGIKKFEKEPDMKAHISSVVEIFLRAYHT